jgi:uncharacterized protein (TIGR03083 family)
VPFDPEKQLANVAVVASESARMARTFRSWPQAHWQRATFCPGWTALDAVAHLATGADFYAQAIAAGRRGTPALPWGASDLAGFRTARAEAVQKLMDGGPDAVLAGFEQGVTTLQEVLESLRLDDLAKVAWHPRGLGQIGGWIGMRLNELVIHDWDIRQPHEANATLAPTALAAMLTVLPWMQQQFLAQRITDDDLDGVHVLRAGTASWAFAVQGKTVTHQAPAPATFDTGISADADSLILLSMGRADPEAKQRSGSLTVSGDAAKAQRLCATLFRTL